MLVHHHFIYQAEVNRVFDQHSEKTLKTFLYSVVKEIEMEILIEPQLAFSYQKAWTGMVGIITSHISFHYWTVEKYLQLDVYSCKKFDPYKIAIFLDEFWESLNRKSIFIKRGLNENFKTTNI